MARTVTCAVCEKKFIVTDAQYKLMEKIGATCCSSECAVEWVEKNDANK